MFVSVMIDCLLSVDNHYEEGIDVYLCCEARTILIVLIFKSKSN